MFFLQHLFGIVAPVVATHHADTEWRQQGATPDVSYRRRPEAVGQYTARFLLYAYQRALLPTKFHCLSNSQIKATSKWVTGDEVIWRGESFLKSVWPYWYPFSAFWRYHGNLLINNGSYCLLSLYSVEKAKRFRRRVSLHVPTTWIFVAEVSHYIELTV